MIDDVRQDEWSTAAELALAGLGPLFGLDVDAARAASLRPLVIDLLQRGERLVRTTEPALEPFVVTVLPSAGEG